MFQFTGCPPLIREVTVLLLPGFPIRKSAGHWLLAPYRSLSRPSSADMAKASAVRPYLLNLPFEFSKV